MRRRLVVAQWVAVAAWAVVVADRWVVAVALVAVAAWAVVVAVAPEGAAVAVTLRWNPTTRKRIWKLPV